VPFRRQVAPLGTRTSPSIDRAPIVPRQVVSSVVAAPAVVARPKALAQHAAAATTPVAVLLKPLIVSLSFDRSRAFGFVVPGGDEAPVSRR
jgi:hypothetical protein